MIQRHRFSQPWSHSLPRGRTLVRPLAAVCTTARCHAVGAPCVARALLEKPAQRRSRSASSGRDVRNQLWLEELHELAGGFWPTQSTHSLGALGVVAHHLSGEDFPTPLDFLSEENGPVGCSKEPTLQQAIQNRQQPLQMNNRRLPPDPHVHPHQTNLVDAPLRSITHCRLEISRSVPHPRRNTRR